MQKQEILIFTSFISLLLTLIFFFFPLGYINGLNNIGSYYDLMFSSSLSVKVENSYQGIITYSSNILAIIAFILIFLLIIYKFIILKFNALYYDLTILKIIDASFTFLIAVFIFINFLTLKGLLTIKEVGTFNFSINNITPSIGVIVPIVLLLITTVMDILSIKFEHEENK